MTRADIVLYADHVLVTDEMIHPSKNIHNYIYQIALCGEVFRDSTMEYRQMSLSLRGFVKGMWDVVGGICLGRSFLIASIALIRATYGVGHDKNSA